MKFAVIKTGGKQYLVQENQELVVDRLLTEEKQVDLETLALGDSEKDTLDMGTPLLKTMVKAEIVEHIKGDKVRVMRFKAKVRYRKTKGFRAHLTKIKIISL